MMTPERRQRLIDLFRAEAKESIAALADGALDVERGEGSVARYDAMFRAAHTIKGGARMLALDEIGAVADRAEVVVKALRDGEIAAGREAGARLIALVDELTTLIWPPEGGSRASGGRSGRRDGSPGHKAAVQAADMARQGKGTARQSGGLQPAAPAAPSLPVDAPAPPARQNTVRVPSDRIDSVVALAAEARRTSDPRALADLLATTEAAALRLRLMPLEGLFADLRRAVRDAAQSDGKQATLVTQGGDVEADAAVVDAASEILLQLIRNAVAHGIEPPEARVASGKPPAGTIRLSVAARGGWLELTVQDDGPGVDEAAVRAKAAERGLSPELPPAELLFVPGLSTRRDADALGGQGVGLDVVRARAAAAGGDVSVTWAPGRGTLFTVRLPITALYERLAVARLGDVPIGVPADAVDSIAASGEGLLVDGPVDELSLLTVPLGPLFAPNALTRRAWILPDGRVGIVLDPQAV